MYDDGLVNAGVQRYVKRAKESQTPFFQKFRDLDGERRLSE